MNRKTSLLSKRRRLTRIAIVLGFIILGLLGNAATTYASGPGGNVADPAVRAVDIAKPAVVRIITAVDARLIVHFSASQSVTFPLDGTQYHIGLSGSGAFISAHGDILTADHVVNPPPEVLDQFAAPDVTQYINQHSSTPATQDQVTQALITGQLPSDANYGTPRSEVFLSTDYTGPLNATNVQTIPQSDYAIVDRIKQQSAVNEKDVAIIHVSSMDDKASIQLGNSTNVQQQDELTIIGFPGNGDVNTTNPTDLLSSSVNKVFVSSISKTTDTGAPVIQVGGNVEHGDSGGPALDSNGNVVGIVSFGSNGPGSTSFLQTSNSAMALVQAQNLDTTPGRFQMEWTQGFTDYAANTPGHWHKAQQEFKQLAANYPSFKAITPYLNYASNQANNEPLPQPSSQSSPSFLDGMISNKWILVGAGGVILLVLLFAALLLLRRRPAPTVPSAAHTFTTMPTVTQNRGMNSVEGTYGRQLPLQPQQGNGMNAFGAPTLPNAGRWSVQPPAQPMQGNVQGTRTIPESQTWVTQLPPQRPPVQPQLNPTNNPNNPVIPANNTGALIPWPCGHMNRPIARYCSVCGEPAPSSPTIRKYEQ